VGLRAVDVFAPQRRTEKRAGFRADIQGLRAVAVAAVVLYHVGMPGARGGFVGVDVFFVISGFLISSHLLDSYRRTGTLDLGGFYARRVRRILPAALTVIVITSAAAILVYPAIALPRVLGDAMASALMVPNFVFASRATDYLADQSPSLFQHYWSLGIEEQFYLLWPVALLLILALAGRRRWAVLALIATLATVSFVVCVALTYTNQPLAFFLLPARAWELLVGAFAGAALVLIPQRVPKAVAIIGGWIGLGAIAGSIVFVNAAMPFPGAISAIPVMGAAAVLYFGANESAAGPSALLSIRPLQFLGAISFSLYLVHWPILILAQQALGDQVPMRVAVKFLLGFVAATVLAWLIYRGVEEPVRKSRWLGVRAARLSVIGGVAACLVVLGSLAGLSGWAVTREGTLGPAVEAMTGAPELRPAGETVAPSNLTPALEDVATSLPDAYGDGCHLSLQESSPHPCVYGDAAGATRIVVFGDSHAAQWLPAVQSFAAQHPDVRVESHTKSSCPAAEVTVLANGVPDRGCDAWRDDVLRSLERNPADLVVISSQTAYALEAEGSLSSDELWERGLGRTLAAVTQAGNRVLVIADTPRLESSPPLCVAGHPRELGECDPERDTALDDAMAEGLHRAASAAGADYVDMNDFICNVERCPVVIGNLLVYRDFHHLTVEFVEYLAPEVSPALAEALDLPDE